MSKFFLDEQLSPRDELINLLDYNGIHYHSDTDEIRFIFAASGYKWENICRFAQYTVLVYGIYPFKVTSKPAALELINGINAQLARGGFFLHESAVVLRTSADLFDAYSSYEAIARTLEYNAGAMVTFWNRLAVLVRSTAK